jgi:Trypsin-co-occurring domain 2
MELQEFVCDVLTAIMAGITQSEGAANKYGAIVNQRDYHNAPGTYGIDEIPPKVMRYKVQEVDFDIAVTVESTGSKGAGGKISVMSIGAGGKVESTSKNASVSHVKFSLPVVLPSVGTTID